MAKYELGVQMACNSCSNAVNRALDRADGITSKNVDLAKQTVDVESDSLSLDDVQGIVAKTGKKVLYAKQV